MSAERDYWQECIAIAAEECDLKLTQEQLDHLASAAESGHEHYGMAFYSPPPSERLTEIEDGWKKKVKDLQRELDDYKSNAETAVKRALKLRRDDHVSIDSHGSVLRHNGFTERIQ
jgi:translation elongation factor EF-Tu-like GTPase